MNEDELRHISVLAIAFNFKRKNMKEEKQKSTSKSDERGENSSMAFNKDKRKK